MTPHAGSEHPLLAPDTPRKAWRPLRAGGLLLCPVVRLCLEPRPPAAGSCWGSDTVSCLVVHLCFEPRPLCGRWLLGSIVILGLMCGVSFSASYQLVALAAKKNTISLGLGCVASGLVVLGLETGLGLASMPSMMQRVALFGACTGACCLFWMLGRSVSCLGSGLSHLPGANQQALCHAHDDAMQCSRESLGRCLQPSHAATACPHPPRYST